MVSSEQQRRCPHCQEFHPASAKFCPQTGLQIAQAARACPVCGFEEVLGHDNCPNCGSWLQSEGQNSIIEETRITETIAQAATDEKDIAPVPDQAPLNASDSELPEKQAFSTSVDQEEIKPPIAHISWLERFYARTGLNSTRVAFIAIALILGLLIGSWAWTLIKRPPRGELAIVSPVPSVTSLYSVQPTRSPVATATKPQNPATFPSATPSINEVPPTPFAVSLVESQTLRVTTPTRQPATNTPLPTPTSIALIAFNSNRSGNNDIYVMYADGSQVTQLTTSAWDDRVPAWSPDGEEIAYQSNEGGDYEIIVYTLKNGRIRQVTNNSCNDYNPVWSPDGERLAFYSDCDGNREIYTVRVDGSDRRQLTQTNAVYNWFPNWSPDGAKITFSSNRSGKYEVFVMNADGSGVRALGRGCVSAFSPDGNRLVFAQYCQDTGQVYIMRADGSNLHTLLEEENNANPSWSPDG